MILAIDTSTRQISLALHDGQRLAAESSWLTDGRHTAELAPSLALMLRRAGVEPGRLQGVAVALGPGSYTGLRIGLSLAQGLALAQNLPLFGVPTFDGLMRAQPPRAEKALAVLQAGRGRVLMAAYHWDEQESGWEAEGGFQLLDWPGLAAEIVERVYLCGEVDEAGAAALRPVRSRVVLAPPALALRRAGFLAEIGWERLRRREADDPAGLRPIYGGQPEGLRA